MTRQNIFRAILLIVVVGGLYRVLITSPKTEVTHLTGTTMGTIQYNIKYLGEVAPNFKPAIDSLLRAFNQSLSTYIPDSEVSRLNKEFTLSNPSFMLLEVLKASQLVYESTKGTFDPTVGPLVNAWGFGPDKKINIPDSSMITQLLTEVGFDKVTFDESQVRMDTGMYLDFSAIAKGYAVDLVGRFLERQGFEHYMVEIGGEVRASGRNDQGENWTIGVEDPMVAADEQKLLAIVALANRSMATSGNYRNYYEVDGRIVAHTIDPRTGYNTNHRLLSASVFAENCMLADGYATAFMVMGMEDTKSVLASTPVEALLIYQDSTGQLRSFASRGLEPFIKENILSD